MTQTFLFSDVDIKPVTKFEFKNVAFNLARQQYLIDIELAEKRYKAETKLNPKNIFSSKINKEKRIKNAQRRLSLSIQKILPKLDYYFHNLLVRFHNNHLTKIPTLALRKIGIPKNKPEGKFFVSFYGTGVWRLNTPADMLNSNKATYAFWMYPTKKNQCSDIMFDGNDAHGHDREIIYSNGKMIYTVNWEPDISKSYNFKGGEIPSGQWTHITIVLDDKISKFYINGVLAGKKDFPVPPHISTSEIFLGRALLYNSYWANQFLGYIADFAVWNVPLNDNQVKKLYENGDIPEKGLLGSWVLNEPIIKSNNRGKLKDLSSFIYGQVRLFELADTGRYDHKLNLKTICPGNARPQRSN